MFIPWSRLWLKRSSLLTPSHSKADIRLLGLASFRRFSAHMSVMETSNTSLAQRIAAELAPHRIVVGFDGARDMWPAHCNHCGVEPRVPNADGMDRDDRLDETTRLHHLQLVEDLVAEHAKEVLTSAAKSLAGDTEGTLYDRRKAELSAPYSKPMLTEQWAELDGIELAARWLEQEAAK